MFLQLQFQFTQNVLDIVLTLNTFLLIFCGIAVELVYSERVKAKRTFIKYVVPLIAVLVGLLIYAAYKQVGKA